MNKQHLIAGFLTLLLTACSGDNHDLRHYINKIKSRPPKTLQSPPTLASIPVFKFPQDAGKRDPFQRVDTTSAAENQRPKHALEAFSLRTLKFVGTLQQGQKIWALIKQPDEQIFRVELGDYLGKHNGRIVRIEMNAISIEQQVKITGKWEKQTTIMSLNIGK